MGSSDGLKTVQEQRQPETRARIEEAIRSMRSPTINITIIAERFASRLEEIGQQIKDAFAEVDVNDNAAIYHVARELQDAHAEIQQHWDKAIAAATRNYNAAKNVELATGAKENAAGEGSVQFSVSKEITPDTNMVEKNISEGRNAVAKLMKEAQESDNPENLIVRNAMYRSSIGYIDFRWGVSGNGEKFKGGYGLAHIIEKRNAENGSGVETVYDVIEAIAKAENADAQYSNNLSDDYHRLRLHYGDTTAVLSKEPGNNHWLLTGWNNNKTAANATGEVHDSSDATTVTPTRTRRNGDATVSKKSITDFAAKSKTENEQHQTWENTVETGGNVIEVDTEDGTANIQFSRWTWEQSDYVTEREEAAETIAEKLGISKKKAMDYIDSVNSVAKMIADSKGRLDYDDTGRSPFVSNAEYGGSFDFTTLCKKRRLLTGTFTAIQRALANTALTANEILEIRKMMDDAGLEVSCGKCYVEGSRASMGLFTKEFLKLYAKYNPGKWVPNMAEMNTPDGIEWVRQTHPEVYEQYEYFWNHYGTLRPGNPNLFASQQKPKLYQMRSAYKELLEKMFAAADPDWDKKPDIKWNFTKFVVDREGNVVARFEPTADMAEVEACIKTLL